MQVISIEEIENDGEAGVFEVLVMTDAGTVVPVMVFYTAEDRIARAYNPNLGETARSALTGDLTLKSEMHEAVLAQRDADREEAEAEQRKLAKQNQWKLN